MIFDFNYKQVDIFKVQFAFILKIKMYFCVVQSYLNMHQHNDLVNFQLKFSFFIFIKFHLLITGKKVKLKYEKSL